MAEPSGSATSVKSETETKATSSNVEMIGLTSEDNDDNTSSGVENGEANVEVDGGSVVKRTRDLRGQRGQRRRRDRLYGRWGRARQDVEDLVDLIYNERAL